MRLSTAVTFLVIVPLVTVSEASWLITAHYNSCKCCCGLASLQYYWFRISIAVVISVTVIAIIEVTALIIFTVEIGSVIMVIVDKIIVKVCPLSLLTIPTAVDVMCL